MFGQKGERVYCISEGNFALVVSDSEVKEYPFIREHLISHQEVIEKVMQQGYDVLPVRFSTVAADSQNLKEKVLQSKKKELSETFKTVEGRVELGLRAFWKNMNDIFQEIVAEHKEIQIAKKEAEKNPHRFKVAQVGELVAKALEQKREREERKILGPLKELAVDFKERERRGDVIITSSAFLVPKEKEKEFDKRVRLLRDEHGERIQFIYVGPIPPFNFVELELHVL